MEQGNNRLSGSDQTRRSFLATGTAALATAKAGIALAQTSLPPDWAFNTRTALTPARVAHASTEAAAQAALAEARNHGGGFALRSGGHCFEGFSQHRQTVIDLGPLNHVRMIGADRAQVGPGATIGDVNAVTGPLGLMLPAGYCQTVGIGGHVGGGGIGLLGRPYGLASDHLEAARVVLADGQIVTASADSHADLFWALRGGGSGSFGILTDLTFRLRPVSSAIYVQYFWEYTPEVVAPIVSEWQRRTQELPRKITSVMYLSALGNGLVQARMFLHSIADQATTIPFARRMFDIAPPNIEPRISIQAPHVIANEIWPREFAPSHDTKIASNFQTRPTSVGRWMQVLTAMAQADDIFLSINLDLKGGAIDDPPIAATAFPHRGTAQMTAQYELRFNANRPRQAQLNWMRDIQAMVAVDASGAAYVNYPDKDLDDFAQRYWGANLERLRQIKAQYDPENMFRHAQSVPLP